ncbi:MAG: DUF3455 domain-containing protein [Acidobacteriota bacterium]
MLIIRSKIIVGLFVVLSLAGLAQAYNTVGLDSDENRRPELPSVCSSLQVGEDEVVAFHAFAIGVQIYRWGGGKWNFVAPSATLYADSGFHGKVATHFGGPTWESNSGSKVIASKTQDCRPDLSAIAWLLLESVTTDGPGIFNNVTHVQRVETTGGLEPALPGAIGEERRVPYTAEYYFYRRP